MQFLINKIQVRGQIGVYGRSIGGIAASYLVGRFPEIVKAFIGDRTMGKFDSIVRNRAKSDRACLHFFYRLFSCNWRINNADGFLENTDCYKIHCFDVNDDVVDIFSSHHHEVSFRKSRVNY